MASFYGWSSTASRLEPLRGGSLLFTIKSPEISGTHFIDLGRMKGWVDIGATPYLQRLQMAASRLNQSIFQLTHCFIIAYELIIYQIKTSCKPSMTRLLKRPLIYCKLWSNFLLTVFMLCKCNGCACLRNSLMLFIVNLNSSL